MMETAREFRFVELLATIKYQRILNPNALTIKPKLATPVPLGGIS
jgi:hypothetical protein